jgi:hypothetical protein
MKPPAAQTQIEFGAAVMVLSKMSFQCIEKRDAFPLPPEPKISVHAQAEGIPAEEQHPRECVEEIPGSCCIVCFPIVGMQEISRRQKVRKGLQHAVVYRILAKLSTHNFDFCIYISAPGCKILQREAYTR